MLTAYQPLCCTWDLRVNLTEVQLLASTRAFVVTFRYSGVSSTYITIYFTLSPKPDTLNFLYHSLDFGLLSGCGGKGTGCPKKLGGRIIVLQWIVCLVLKRLDTVVSQKDIFSYDYLHFSYLVREYHTTDIFSFMLLNSSIYTYLTWN